MVRVAAGAFSMGSKVGDLDERPVRRVQLEAFEIDRHEVAQRAYGECVRARVCAPARQYSGLVAPDLPAVGVSWHDARDYCVWRNKRLPSEAEWERVARGRDDRRFPWGTNLDCARANFGNFDGAGLCAPRNPGKPLPVAGRPQGASPVGALDMAGNVWEWVADWYGPYDLRSLRAPTGPDSGTDRVLRGGSCCSYFSLPTVSNRHRLEPSYTDRDIGFRCARSVGNP